MNIEDMIWQILITLVITGLTWFVWHKNYFMKIIQELKDYIKDNVAKSSEVAKEQTVRDVVAKEQTTAKQKTLEEVQKNVGNIDKEVYALKQDVDHTKKTLDVFNTQGISSVDALVESFQPFISNYATIIETHKTILNENLRLGNKVKELEQVITKQQERINELEQEDDYDM